MAVVVAIDDDLSVCVEFKRRILLGIFGLSNKVCNISWNSLSSWWSCGADTEWDINWALETLWTMKKEQQD